MWGHCREVSAPLIVDVQTLHCSKVRSLLGTSDAVVGGLLPMSLPSVLLPAGLAEHTCRERSRMPNNKNQPCVPDCPSNTQGARQGGAVHESPIRGWNMAAAPARFWCVSPLCCEVGSETAAAARPALCSTLDRATSEQAPGSGGGIGSMLAGSTSFHGD